MYEYTVREDLILHNGISKETDNEANSPNSLEHHTNERTESLNRHHINHSALSPEYSFVRYDLRIWTWRHARNIMVKK